MANLKFYQCHNPRCQAKDKGKFLSNRPPQKAICPQCGIQEADPKFGKVIQRLVLVHFDPPTDIPSIGQSIRACQREKIIQAEELPNGTPNPWHAGTGCFEAVTCPACKETIEYKAAQASAEDEEGPNLMAAAFERLQPLAVKV